MVVSSREWIVDFQGVVAPRGRVVDLQGVDGRLPEGGWLLPGGSRVKTKMAIEFFLYMPIQRM